MGGFIYCAATQCTANLTPVEFFLGLVVAAGGVVAFDLLVRWLTPPDDDNTHS